MWYITLQFCSGASVRWSVSPALCSRVRDIATGWMDNHERHSWSIEEWVMYLLVPWLPHWHLRSSRFISLLQMLPLLFNAKLAGGDRSLLRRFSPVLMLCVYSLCVCFWDIVFLTLNVHTHTQSRLNSHQPLLISVYRFFLQAQHGDSHTLQSVLQSEPRLN